jgi:hypothetical protein
MLNVHIRTVLVGLVVTSILLVTACQEGPGAQPRPVPTWSPPKWIHGTWTASSELASAKLVASRYNVVIDIRASGVTLGWDLAELTEDGVATITHDVGVTGGQRHYGVTVSTPPSANIFLCFEESSTVIACYWSVINRGQRERTGPFYLTKQ